MCLFDVEYWCDNVCDLVYFVDVLCLVLVDGYILFVEVGFYFVLCRVIEDVFKEQGCDVNVVLILWMNKLEYIVVK